MKQTIVLVIFGGLLAYLLSSYATGAASNGQGNLTGARGSSGCSCHNSTTSLGTTVELDSAGVLVTTYHPGIAYRVKIKGVNNSTHTNLVGFGFQVSTVKVTGAGTTTATQAGTWGTLPPSTHTTTTGSCSVVEQSAALIEPGTGAVGTVYVDSFPWTAPVAGTGSIKIYGVLNAVNDDGSSSRDYAQAATAVTITEAVATAPIASVAISTPNQTVCAGSSVTFTATPTNGGTTPSYQWKINGTNAGTNSATFTTTALTNGQVVTCVMTSNLTGVTGSPATSNSLTMTVNPALTPSVSIATANQTVCAGTSVTFTATPTNGGTPSYQWKVGTTNVGTNSATYTTTTLTNGQVVSCVMTSTAACASPTTATSNSITMTVNPNVTPSVSISTPNQTVCTGASVTFTAAPTNGGTPSYQWKIGTTNVGTNSPTFTTTTLTNGQVVTCVMTSTASCASPATATSNAITMTVTASVTPSISISTPTTTICSGASVTFTATATNGGAAPSYQWKVNGSNVGTNSPSFVTSSLTNGQVVTCVLTSNSTCASPLTVTSNSITITVGTQVPTITIHAASTSVCAGAPDTFTAVITNGGTSPTFQWKVGTTNVGTNSSTFITSSLVTGSVVTCVLTSSSACASPTMATSAGITVTVNPTVVPTLAISARHDTICLGTADTFAAVGTHLGTAPAYQWQINGSNAGSGSPAFISSALTNGNTVKCIVTSNAACVSPATATSNTVTLVVHASPPVTITPSGQLMLCAGDSLHLTASGGTSYHWTTTDTSSSIWVHQAGTYNVTGSNGSCAATPVTPAIVTVNTPVTPTITQSHNLLTSSPAIGYQWILNNSALPGDTSRTFNMTQSGNYAIITRDSNGCYARSISYIFTHIDSVADTTHVSISNVDPDLQVKLYPIPNQGSFVIEAVSLSDADLAIYDIYGQKLYQQKLSTDRTQISGLNLAPAMYFVTISDHGRAATIKMQVTRE